MNDYGFMDLFGPEAQARNLQQMGNDVMDANAIENRSRVEQAREERQQQHEIEMEQLRHTQLLERLQAEQQAANNMAYNQRQASGQQAESSGGGYSRTFNPQKGGWEYS